MPKIRYRYMHASCVSCGPVVLEDLMKHAPHGGVRAPLGWGHYDTRPRFGRLQAALRFMLGNGHSFSIADLRKSRTEIAATGGTGYPNRTNG